MDNLTVEGKNISKRSTNVTNCITEIPQDIHYELSNGVLTLKAGSSAYMPDGFESDGTTPKFTKVTNTTDLSYTPTWGEGYKCLLTAYVNSSGNISGIGMCRGDLQFSGETAPTTTIGGTTWYDTSANKIKVWRDNTWKYDITTEHRCLFLGIVTVETGNVITSIDQVFNGFGYIGSTVFALPGVKGLIPDGRNEDGTLKNIEYNVLSVITRTASSGTDSYGLAMSGSDITWRAYFEQETPPTIVSRWYNPKTNITQVNSSGALDTWVKNNYTYIGKIEFSSGKITSFTPKTTFHAVDYNDLNTRADTSLSNLQDGGIQQTVRTGMIIPYDGSSAPSGWLKCDGSAKSRTTYADLFAVIGTTYGSGDGSTTFNLPSANDFPSGYPSTSYSSVTLGSSGTVYTATKNGWYSMYGSASADGQYIMMKVTSSSGSRVQQVQALSGQWIALSHPVRKGDKLCVQYNVATSATLRFFTDSGRASIIKT